MSAHEALVAATGLHAGFQLVVTLLVYPALAEVPAARWAEAHDRHSRRIVSAVALVYGVAAAACLWVLFVGPRGAGEWVALVATTVAAATTAGIAAPTHAKLGAAGPEPGLLRKLLAADRVRLGAALLALVAAVV